mgnify:FL=1
MKKSGFKKKTFKEARAKLLEKQEVMRAYAKLGKAKKKVSKGQITGNKRKPKRLKDGSLDKSEKTRILKKKLWSVFSQYIRKSWADHNGYLLTVDGELVHWKDCDCGHLRHNTERNALLGGNELWYYENNFAPQSNQGNRLNKDDSAQKYMLWAVKKYGTDEVDKMFRMRNTYRMWTYEELEAKYQHYKALFENL